MSTAARAGIGFIALAALTLWVLGGVPAAVWDGLMPASCLPDGCFCEAIRAEQSIRQPANTLSSLLFALVGLPVLMLGRRAPRSHPFGAYHRAMFGLSALVIGVGSAFYHASMTFVGQFFDIFGMYLLAALMLVYAVQRLVGWRVWTAAAAYCGFNAALTVLQVGVPETRRFAFGLVLVGALLLEAVVWRRVRPPRDYRWFWGGLALFAAAYAVWILDNSGVWCTPTSWLQGHAVWHGLGALATAALWRWYVSE
jgi:hypothetical protein